MQKFIKAVKQQLKLRLGIYSPSGGGKTFTALSIAKGLGGRVGLIDSERQSARKYADRFDFDVIELDENELNIDTYITCIKEAEKNGINVLIIDSATHAWKDLLAEIDKIAQAKFSGNTWAAWSKGTPKQNAFINAILGFDGHVIVTMRAKTEWVIEKNDKNNKTAPVRVGLAPEQGKGIEFEFDMLMSMTAGHDALIEKDRTGKFQDKIIEKPGEKFGVQIREWLNEGEVAPIKQQKTSLEAPKEQESVSREASKAAGAGVSMSVTDKNHLVSKLRICADLDELKTFWEKEINGLKLTESEKKVFLKEKDDAKNKLTNAVTEISLIVQKIIDDIGTSKTLAGAKKHFAVAEKKYSEKLITSAEIDAIKIKFAEIIKVFNERS